MLGNTVGFVGVLVFIAAWIYLAITGRGTRSRESDRIRLRRFVIIICVSVVLMMLGMVLFVGAKSLA